MIRKKLKNIKAWLVAVAAWIFTCTAFHCIRLRIAGRIHWRKLRREGRGSILATWHGQQLFGMYFFRYQGVCILNSLSRDGDYSSRLMRLYGWRSIRGSSNRGAVRGLLEMTRKLKQGFDVGITPDGPRGPIYHIEPGVIYMAQKTGSPIIPVGMAFTHRLILKSWDRFLLPLPWGRGALVMGKPLYFRPAGSDAELDRQNEELVQALHRVNRIAEEQLAGWQPVILRIFYNIALWAGHLMLQSVKFFPKMRRLAVSIRRGKAADCGSSPFWFHAASVGEIGAIRPVYERLAVRFPSVPRLITAVTAAGLEAAEKMDPSAACRPFPLDNPFRLENWIKETLPRAIIIAETEIWPNLYYCARKHLIPLILINARISDRAWPRFKRWRMFFIPVLQSADLIFAQSARDASRFREMGVSAGKIIVTGNTKFDRVQFMDGGMERSQVFQELHIAETVPVIVAGSVHPGEFPMLLRVYRRLRAEIPALRLVVAPRHLEKMPFFMSEMGKANERFALHSRLKPGWREQILCIDSYGVLARIYAAANTAFVGGTLVRIGGHSLLEPLAWGVPVVAGPYLNNTRDVAALLQNEGLLEVAGEENMLYEAFKRRLIVPDHERKELAEKIGAVLAAQKGAADRTASGIEDFLEGRL
ncbi:MAG: glycosyltransferase N-terminal domain-containing protein [Bacillota bacterium]